MDDAGKGARGCQPHLTPRLTTAVATWGVDLTRSQLLGGSTGLNLRADSADGPVVVRVHRRHVTAERVDAQQRAREAANRAGVPTALAVLGRDGERQVVVDGCVIEVERFVDNDAKMDTPARIASALPWLGRLHDALAAAELPAAGDDLRFANYIAAADTVPKVSAGASRIRSAAPSHSKIADTAEVLAMRLERAGTAHPPGEPQWCHGDFWDNNVLFRDGGVCLVTDFGFMNRRPRIDDLALTCYFALCDLGTATEADLRHLLVGMVDAYEQGTMRVLSASELEALPLAIARQPLWSIGVWAAELDDPAAVDEHLQGHDMRLQLTASILDEPGYWMSALHR
jgi:Ser/Thr protein kinase RdoA (MazF antagonist)